MAHSLKITKNGENFGLLKNQLTWFENQIALTRDAGKDCLQNYASWYTCTINALSFA